MDIELIKNKKGIYEIWVDNQFVYEIKKRPDLNLKQYEDKAHADFDTYVANVKSLSERTSQQPKTVKKVSI